MLKLIYLVSTAAIIFSIVACAPAAAPQATPTVGAAPSPAAAPTKAPAAVTPTAAAKAAAATATPVPVKVRVGIAGSITDAVMFLANDKGFFKEQGIDAEFVTFKSATEMLAPVGTNDLDVGALVVTPGILNAKDRNVDIKLVASKSSSRPGYEAHWVVLRKDLADSGQVKTPADLKGMAFAIFSRGSVAQYAAELVLAKGGLTEKDVAGGEFQVLGRPDYIPAFANKAIAAGFNIEPFVTALEQQGLAKKWFGESALVPGTRAEGASIAFSPKMAANKDVAQRWMIGYLKGARFYLDAIKTKQGKTDVASLIAKYVPGTDTKGFDSMEPDYVDPNGGLDMVNLDAQNKWMVERGFYTGKTTFKDLVDPSFSEYAVQKLGKYQ